MVLLCVGLLAACRSKVSTVDTSRPGSRASTVDTSQPVSRPSTLDTSRLSRVEVTSFQALPPPYEPGHATLASSSSLQAFEDAIRADHIGLGSAGSNGGCTGRISYTVSMIANGKRTNLNANECGSGLTSNMTGNVKQFVSFLASLTH